MAADLLEIEIVVVDTETHDHPDADPDVIEIAGVATSVRRPNLGMFHSLVWTDKPITPEASAVHGRTNDNLIGAPPREAAISYLQGFILRFNPHSTVKTLAAHNAEFDAGRLNMPGYRYICTHRLALHLWSDLPNYSNQALCYRFGLRPDTFGVPPHHALADTAKTAALLRFEIERALESADFANFCLGADPDHDAVQMLIDWADEPVRLINMPFGKHEGPMRDVPTDYIEWALGPKGLTDIKKDLLFTLEIELRERKGRLPL